MSNSLSARLARFAQEAAPSAQALEMMRLSLFDWAACGIAGRGEPVSTLVRDMVMAEAGAAQASLFGGGFAPARGAALVNGTISHALDYDDTHFAHIGHPSVAVLPAVLAVAEREGADGGDLLRAALIGVELSVRVGVWLGRGHYQLGFHQTGTAGAFGAAAGAGLMLGCDEAELAQALALVSTRASGLKSQFGTMGKPYNAGQAAAAGVEAALLARAGISSNLAALEGELGFGPTHAGMGDLSAFEGLGRRWLFETISHKFHACCHGTHAMIEALRAEALPQDLQRIEVFTHPRWMSVCNLKAPDTGLGVKFSYTHIAALVWAGHDTGALNSFSDGYARDAGLQSLRGRVEVFEDAQVGEMQCRIRLVRKGGGMEARWADLAAPLTLEERQRKLRAKAGALLGERAETLSKAIWPGHDAPDIAGLSALMREA